MDCDWGRKNTDVSGKYGVRGYPTVLFTDPDGRVLESLGSRNARSVRAQIEGVAARYPAK